MYLCISEIREEEIPGYSTVSGLGRVRIQSFNSICSTGSAEELPAFNLWDMTMCNQVESQRRFGGNYCLILQSLRVKYAKSRKIRSNAVYSFE
jgi:hypothetical protein